MNISTLPNLTPANLVQEFRLEPPPALRYSHNELYALRPVHTETNSYNTTPSSPIEKKRDFSKSANTN